ncbi:uncharacterized protein LOC121408989 isoform X2 [Lytechinus variegatus]|uniref:uncharacterized protein LOC121408989 isoform X2 n=1 Tax=Lytechinus variegatus TaxID=7654 RepID=UPI001BB0D885|nr:uncharacterized protein LOC121408989 isoform X2 [Lytechinus variegatus]
MAVAREPSPPIAMPHSIQSYQGSSADGGDNESVMSDLSWDGTPDENILSGSSRAATSLAIHEEDEGEPDLSCRFLDDPDGDHTLIMEDDVYHQLAEMEEKLKMAGEFGNALLEENQELRILNQQAKQETSASIEALEQERHELRMKLETAHTEKENMSYDLRMEVESLRKELANQSEALKVANSNKQGIIGELLEQKDQNLKLANQLHEMTRERNNIHDRLEIVQKQNESMSLFHHESSLGKSEQLRMEVGVLKEENGSLRERIVVVSSEHMTMMSKVEEAKERNMMLEKQVLELEQRLQFRETELRDLSRLHDETMQELGAARSRANTHCSSSLYDELETAELTGYESSEEDLEVDDKADVMISKFLGSRDFGRQMSLAEELAQSLGEMESSRMGQNREMQEMSLADEMNATDTDNTPQHEKTLEEFVERLDRESLNESHQLQDDHSDHKKTSLADELTEAGFGGGGHQGDFIGSGTPQQDGANSLDAAQHANTLSLADELSQVSSSMPDVKLESSSTLVGFGGDVEVGGDKDDKMQSGFIVGGDDEDQEEQMILGVPMATQCLNQGLSLADELAGMGYQQSYNEDEAEGVEEEECGDAEGCDVFGRSERGAEMVASRVREGGGTDFLTPEPKGQTTVGTGDGGRTLGRGGSKGAVGEAAEDDDDADITSLETPKASPSRSPKPGDLHMKYRQIEDVLHWVHVTLTHIILELHSLVRLPLTDLGIMHASSVLHSVHPSTTTHRYPASSTPWSTASNTGVHLDDDDEEEDDNGDLDEGRRSELIGDKVKSQLSVLRSMLSIVVNGSPKMLNGAYRGRQEDQERIAQLEGHAEALERELKDTRLQVDLLEAEIERLDKVLLRKDEQIDRLHQGRKRIEDCVIEIEEEEERARRMDSRSNVTTRFQSNMDNRRIHRSSSEMQSIHVDVDSHQYRNEPMHDDRWQTGQDGCSSQLMSIPPPSDQLSSSFSSRSRSAPEFGPKTTFSWR